jgi:hypothetical protein
MSRGPWITSVRHSHRLHWYIHKARRGLHNTELHFEHSHRILTREELADLPPDVRTLYAEIPPWALANDLRCVSNGRRSLENFCKRNST